MSPKQACPNCSPSTGTRIVFTLESGIRVLQCRGCKLRFAAVYPEVEKSDTDIYGDRYFAGAIEKRKERYETFTRLLREIESVLGRKGRLLDVGCGEGTLVEVAANSGWEAEGTDIATAAVQYACERRGLKVHQGAVDDISLGPGSFDAIVLNHVLEHVRNPRVTLSHVRDLLATGGVVRIEVPNLAGLSARTQNLQSRFRLKKNRWRHYETGHHFWFFTPSTLSRTILAAGLSTLRLAAPYEQWDQKSVFDRATNVLYKMTLWGGHLVAYARRASK